MPLPNYRNSMLEKRYRNHFFLNTRMSNSLTQYIFIFIRNEFSPLEFISWMKYFFDLENLPSFSVYGALSKVQEKQVNDRVRSNSKTGGGGGDKNSY